MSMNMPISTNNYSLNVVINASMNIPISIDTYSNIPNYHYWLVVQ